MNCYKCNKPIPDYSLVCSYCGAEMSQRARMGESFGFGTMPPVMPLGMAWFNFLIYFYLFFESISLTVSGLSSVAGLLPSAMLELDISSDLPVIYAQMGRSYRVIDIIYGFLCLGFAAFGFVTRFRLSARRKNAPLFLLMLFTIPPLVSFAYAMGLYIIAKYPAFSYYSPVMQLVTQSVFVYINYIYFKKRKHLFKNQ